MIKDFVIIFLFIFGWFIFPGLDIITILSLGFILYLFKRPKIDRFIHKFTILLLPYIVYSLSLFILKQSSDIDIFLRIIRLYINFLGGIGLIYWFIDRKTNTQRLVFIIFLTIGAHALLMSLMYFLSPLREFVYKMAYTLNIVNNTYSIISGFRIPGLTYGLSQTSVIQGWGVLIGLNMLLDKQNVSKATRNLIKTSMPFLLFSIFISGRSGIILTLIGIVILSLTHLASNFSSRKTIYKYVPISVLFIVFILFTVNWFRNTNFDDENLAYTQYHINEAFTLLETGESKTAETVRDMVLIPEDEMIFIFGSSTLDRNVLGINTDIGYIRILYHSGILGSFLYYLPFLFLLFNIIRNYPKGTFRILATLIFVSSLVLHAKEVSVYTRNQWSIQILFLYPLILRDIKTQRKN